MRKFGFGTWQTNRPCARCPHQLRSSRRRSRLNHNGSTYVLNRLEQCPEAIRDCIAELQARAEIESERADRASYVARQIYFAVKELGRHVKKLGWYIEQFAITVLAIQAKAAAVQFRFLLGSSRFIINLLPEDALSA